MIPEPAIIENPNFDDLRIECEEFMRFIREDYFEDGLEDYENAILEAALIAFFGRSVWVWITEMEMTNE
jgi:hypothetical protein